MKKNPRQLTILTPGSAPIYINMHHNYFNTPFDFLRYVLGVQRNTNRVMLYFETGRMPLYINHFIRMFKYWFKMLQTSNCVLKAAYDFLQSECENLNFRVVIRQAMLKISCLIWALITYVARSIQQFR